MSPREEDVWETFGYKTSWLAVASAASSDVADALDVGRFEPCSWRAGVPGAGEGLAVFVTPPIRGFVLVVGDWVGASTTAGLDARVERLSERFGEAQLFVSQRVNDFYLGLRARGGVIEGRPALADESRVLATARLWSLDPTQLGGSDPPAPGLAAPDPTPSMGRIVEQTSLRQSPAASRREAEIHARSAFQACPACGDPHIALYTPGRDALPWEDFALALSMKCANGRCGARHRIEYPAGPTFDVAIGAEDPRWSASDAPSELMTADACLTMLRDLLDCLNEMPSWGYQPDMLHKESRRMARQALGAAIELARTDPDKLVPEKIEWLRSVASRGLPI